MMMAASLFYLLSSPDCFLISNEKRLSHGEVHDGLRKWVSAQDPFNVYLVSFLGTYSHIGGSELKV